MAYIQEIFNSKITVIQLGCHNDTHIIFHSKRSQTGTHLHNYQCTFAGKLPHVDKFHGVHFDFQFHNKVLLIPPLPVTILTENKFDLGNQHHYKSNMQMERP